MKYFYILFLALLGMSCSHDTNSKQFKHFPNTIHLFREEIKTTPNLYFVGGMALMDSVLITVDLKADTFFQVFKLPGYSYIGGCVRKGNGPEEEVLVDPFIKHVSENLFLYRNATSIKIMDFNLKTDSLELLNRIDIPEELMGLWQVFKLGDNIIGSDMNNETKKEFVGFNINSKEKFDFGGDYPKVEREVDNQYKNILFAKTSTVKPDGSKFASVYDKFPILRISSKDGELQKEIKYDNNQLFPNALIDNNSSEASINEIMQNYRKIKSSNQYIYALYIGKKQGEIGMGLSDFSNEIHVWDWDGNPIAKILLDKKIFSFDVDAHDQYIISASVNSLDRFYKYYIKF